MERDEREIARTKVSAETIAEIINSFMEPISYKALIFFTIFTIGSLVFSNITFGLFQKRHREDPGYQQHIQRITHSHTSKSAS
ncbi:hypothetical protein PHYBLDRAFT_160216 [Phycomyces blakesleeanus NRRL 1555(-)]|uniref:Brl1/Brr6 domain-containing protein n=2 Tax=Phycomyces blakesleeanus TaxID=4837 RepID=A0A167KGR9_PHYB8|nr:hypothetical protein PHYBLDRAFT_160216 [Phycomyces blakesleeanus NRRL 1555(-)]OAD68057.1 hypothetical protein PHYBLDRAFT_160216 [Phycomyces blakesleeanus NRRL 1555(-)]|eukprot:XP_018286097.1 hypothetical protein PHYBLDRAFT_160216 [Phycomyces blakesleeanus NRRL 1555(-)]